jgi:hypothetical protein
MQLFFLIIAFIATFGSSWGFAMRSPKVAARSRGLRMVSWKHMPLASLFVASILSQAAPAFADTTDQGEWQTSDSWESLKKLLKLVHSAPCSDLPMHSSKVAPRSRGLQAGSIAVTAAIAVQQLQQFPYCGTSSSFGTGCRSSNRYSAALTTTTSTAVATVRQYCSNTYLCDSLLQSRCAPLLYLRVRRVVCTC